MSDFNPNDPNRNAPYGAEPAPGYLKWVYGGIMGALVLALVVFAVINDSGSSSDGQRAATAPATTTGSGAARTTTGSGRADRPAPPVSNGAR
jgi:hypothetical protein